MRKLLLALVIVALASPAAAQTGTVCIYSDALATECNFVDGVGLQQFFVQLIDAPGATAVGFSAPVSPCMAGMSWLSDTAVWPVTIGDSQNGVSVGFGACLSSPIHVLTINYFSNGIVGTDCAYSTASDPQVASPLPEWVDCTQQLRTANVSTSYINSAIPCDCELQEPDPTLQVTPSSLVFQTTENNKILSIANIGFGTLQWSISKDEPWVSVSAVSGTGDANLTVTIDRSGLSNGTHNANLFVSSNGGTATVPITVFQDSQGPPVLSVSVNSLTFQSSEDQKFFEIANIGGGTLDYTITPTASWLSTVPSNGSVASGVPANIQVDVNRAGLSTGTYNAQLNIASNGGADVVLVTLHVIAGPLLDVNPTSLYYDANTSALGLTINNIGNGTLNWTATPNAAWVSVAPTSGATTGTESATVTVDRTGLADGFYSTSIDITSDGGSVNIPVTMDVLTNPIIDVTPASLFFPDGTDQLALQVKNIGVNTLNWTATPDETWIAAVPNAGAEVPGPGTTVLVDVDRTNLLHGTHNGNVEITSDGGNRTIPVTVEVIKDPILSITPPTITFTTTQNSKAFLIENVGAGELQWQIVESIPWLSFGLTSGTGDETVFGTVDVPNAPSGPVDESVQINSNGGNLILTVLWRPTVSATAGTIGIFMDTIGASACLEEPSVPGLFTVHVVHTNSIGASASQWAAPMPICWIGAVWLSDAPIYPVTVGNSQAGVAIGYGACLPTPNHILSINVFSQAQLGVGCCAWSVVPDPNVPSGQIEVVNCLDQLIFGNGLTSFVSAPPCNCGIGVRTEHSTWGAIKSIYADEEEMQRLRRMQR